MAVLGHVHILPGSLTHRALLGGGLGIAAACSCQVLLTMTSFVSIVEDSRERVSVDLFRPRVEKSRSDWQNYHDSGSVLRSRALMRRRYTIWLVAAVFLALTDVH